jgi:hypothetical protein
MIVEEIENVAEFSDVHSLPAWRIFLGKSRLLIPLWVLSVVCAFEVIGLSGWRFGRSLTDLLLPAMAIACVLGFPFAMLAWTTFRRGASGRKIELDSAGIKTPEQNPEVVPWGRVGRLSLNELKGATGVSVFAIGYARRPGTSFFTRPLPGTNRIPPAKRGSRDLAWARLILRKPDQTEPLRKGIDLLRASNPAIPQLREVGGGSVAALWLTLCAMYFLLHGLPLLGIGLQKHHQPENSVEAIAGTHEDKMATVIGPMLARHFHNERQLRRFFIVAGAALTLAGIGTYSASFLLMRRERDANERSKSAFLESIPKGC